MVGPEFQAILISAGVALATWLGVAILHVAIIAFLEPTRKEGSAGLSSASLFLLFLAGTVFLWGTLKSLPISGSAQTLIPAPARMGALFLYWTGCLVYMEARSLLSRGYSLRILLDLLDRGREAEEGRLKSGYGEGLGLGGLLEKRLRTLAGLRFLRMDGDRVGPLTVMGRGIARSAIFIRRLLCLDLVG